MMDESLPRGGNAVLKAGCTGISLESDDPGALSEELDAETGRIVDVRSSGASSRASNSAARSLARSSISWGVGVFRSVPSADQRLLVGEKRESLIRVSQFDTVVAAEKRFGCLRVNGVGKCLDED